MPGSIRLFARTGLLAFLFVFVSETFGQTVIPDSLLYQPWDESALEYHSHPWTPGCDSIQSAYKFRRKTYYYNLDSIIYRIVHYDYRDIKEDLRYLYFITEISNPALRAGNRRKLADALKQYNSKAIERELDVFDSQIYFSLEKHEAITPDIWNFFRNVMDKYERKGDRQTKLRIMHNLLYNSSGYPTLDFSSRIEKERIPVIKLINESLATLEGMNEPYIFGNNVFYTHIALIYYDFKYYDKAVPLLWKSLEQPRGHFYDRGVMRARDYLGHYYAMKGDYNRSDSLYLSILTCPEQASMRGIDNVVAIGAIATNNHSRGYKEEAERLYKVALPQALLVKDSTLAGGYALRLGRLYMEKEELDKTRGLIDSARLYLVTGNLPLRNWERFYTLSRDYYLKINRADIASRYIDSIAMVRSEEENIYNTRILAYAEQEAYEAERALKEEQLKKANTRTLLVGVILASSLILLCIVCCSYRKLRQKNLDLFLRIKAQDTESARHEELLLQDDATPVRKEFSGNTRQRILFIRLREYLVKDKNFAKTDIDVNRLMAELSTNRTYLFDAIKTYTGKTLQEYMNQLRLEEAKRLLETTDDIIESIALSCGYNSVRTFYRLFKTNYHMSPATYRKLAKNQ